MMGENEKVRVDKYLWSIRIFKTRSAAADACEKGRVKLNDIAVKASRTVKTGDEYDIRTEARKWKIKVINIIHNRVQYSEAIKHYIDNTPEEDKLAIQFQATSFHTGKRLSKVGRPTKKQRREMDEFLDEGEEA